MKQIADPAAGREAAADPEKAGRKKKKDEVAGLAEINSKEAYSAVVKYQQSQRDPSAKTTAKNTGVAATELARSRALLAKIADNLGKGPALEAVGF
jgi:hypothetical protein